MTAKLYARDGGTAGASDIEITDVAPFFDDNNVPLIQLGNAAQNGSASQGYFQVQDPTSALIQSTGLWLPPHTRILWTEDATGDELWLAYGRVVGGERGRGDVKGADNIEHHWTVDDANVDLRGLAFTEDWVRPAETDTARLYALQAYILNGSSSTSPSFRPSTVITVSSSHLAPNTNTYLMPAKTYPAGTQPQEVVDDCTSSSGKVYGVVPHHTGGSSHLCLLYIVETDHSTYASTVKISDKVANWDPEDLTAPVFEPIWDQGMAVVKDDDSAISGLVSRYGPDDRFVYVNEPSQEDDYEHWIDSYSDADSLTLAQATARATAIRSYRAAGNATFRVTVLMLAEQHTLLGAGMSLQIDTAPILGGYYRGTYIDARIVTCTWEPLPDGRYWAHLELNRGRRGAGSGKAVTPQPMTGCIDTFGREVDPGAWGTGEWGIHWDLNLTTGVGAGTPALAKNAFSVSGGMGLYDMNQQAGAPIDTTVDAEADHTWSLPADMEVTGTIYDHGGYAMLRDIDWLVCASPSDASGRFTLLMQWKYGDYSLIYYASPGNPIAGTAKWEAWLTDTSWSIRAEYGAGTLFSDPGTGATFVNRWTVEMSTVSGKYCVGATMFIDPSLRNDSPPTHWGGAIAITATTVTGRAWGPDSLSGAATISDTTSAPTSLIFNPAMGLDMVVGATMVSTPGECSGTSPYWARSDDPRFDTIVTDHGGLTGLGDDDHTQYIKDSEFAAKGDLLVGSGSGTFDNLTAGSNGKVLTTDSTQTLGVKWETPTGSGSGPFEDEDTFTWKFISPATAIASTDLSAYLDLSPNDAFLKGSTGNAIDIMGGKVYTYSDFGLVLPILSSDPAGGDSESAQVYYNDTTEFVRFYQNGAWTVPRSLFLPAAEAKLDSATAANIGASPDLTGVVAYADGSTQGAIWSFMVPSDWDSGVITLQPVWSPGSTDGTAHTVRWSIVAKTVAAGSTVTSSGTTTTFTGASGARTVGVVVYDTATSTTLTPGSTNEVFRFTLRRIGADAADTYVGVVNLLGVIVGYTARL